MASDDEQEPVPEAAPRVPHLHSRSSDGPIAISRIQVPAVAWATGLLIVAGGVFSMTSVWSQTTAHATDRTVHVDARERETGGGVAYKNDVSAVRSDFEQKLVAEGAKTRAMIKTMAITCTPSRTGIMTCKVDLD